ncbi:hypothetical protein RclHR1_22200001 [Rhizophagus clarus]|uniref:Uncharacterized protein n=1 Tax=Rhizophagus clarus TaxID=94130 RepID=A0A2Z6R9W0_9GLOM|nr:hypothetical protein RclHR1_22200001 [Rhizophagus clarus]
MKGDPGKEKDIIGSSAQGFGTDLEIITVIGGVKTLRIGCWIPGLGMLLAFLDELDLGILPAFLDELDLGMLPAFLNELDLRILLDSRLEI